MLIGIDRNSEKIKMQAVKKVVGKYLGLINSEKTKKENDKNLYSHTNTRGRTRYFKVFKSFNSYNKWFKENKDLKQKLHKASMCYVVELKGGN